MGARRSGDAIMTPTWDKEKDESTGDTPFVSLVDGEGTLKGLITVKDIFKRLEPAVSANEIFPRASVHCICRHNLVVVSQGGFYIPYGQVLPR